MFYKKINKVIVIFNLLSLIMLSIVFVSSAFADGGLVIRDPDTLQWSLQKMNKQLCAINYENGFENMLLAIYVSDLKGEKAAWIFPVPAKPDKIAIDIIKNFPIFYGRNIEVNAKNAINGTFSLMRLSQVYTLPFEGFFVYSRGGLKGRMGRLKAGVEVHEHIEKMGLTTELITAEDGSQFINYLKNKELELPSDFKSALDEYIGQEYSFVASWISDIERFKEETEKKDRFGGTFNSLSVFITFLTNKIYFPLKPTSVYGSTKIPMTIYIMNHVTPEIYSGIKNSSQVKYFVDTHYSVPSEFLSFFNKKSIIKNLKYTIIHIDSPSKYLTNDLWMNERVPTKVIFSNFLTQYNQVWGLFLFILCSCLSSLFAGLIAFRGKQPSKRKFTLFGLWNFLTLIGVAIASYRLKIDTEFTQKKESFQPKLSLEKAIKIALTISGVLCILFFGFSFVASRSALTLLPELLLPFIITFLIIALFIGPFVYIFANSRFILLFTLFFLVITIIFQIILQSIFYLFA